MVVKSLKAKLGSDGLEAQGGSYPLLGAGGWIDGEARGTGKVLAICFFLGWYSFYSYSSVSYILCLWFVSKLRRINGLIN